jgi:hypothetical protein
LDQVRIGWVRFVCVGLGQIRIHKVSSCRLASLCRVKFGWLRYVGTRWSLFGQVETCCKMFRIGSLSHCLFPYVVDAVYYGNVPHNISHRRRGRQLWHRRWFRLHLFSGIWFNFLLSILKHILCNFSTLWPMRL